MSRGSRGWALTAPACPITVLGIGRDSPCCPGLASSHAPLDSSRPPGPRRAWTPAAAPPLPLVAPVLVVAAGPVGRAARVPAGPEPPVALGPHPAPTHERRPSPRDRPQTPHGSAAAAQGRRQADKTRETRHGRRGDGAPLARAGVWPSARGGDSGGWRAARKIDASPRGTATRPGPGPGRPRWARCPRCPRRPGPDLRPPRALLPRPRGA